MKLSIIVTCYNRADYIERCISSILPQLTPEVELIVINDGSTDQSLDILNELNKDNRFRIETTPNRGISATRNHGISVSLGEYIWFIDGDDFITGNAVKKILDTIQKQPDVIAFNHTRKFDQNYIDKTVFTDNLTDFAGLFKTEALFVWDKVYRKNLFTDISFNENLTILEDTVLNMMVSLLVEKIATISDILYVYECSNQSSISRNRNIRHLVRLSHDSFTAHEILNNHLRFITNPELKYIWEERLNTGYIGHIFSLVRFYNCHSVKRALNIYHHWGVYPFRYTGSTKMKLFAFIVNHRHFWTFHRIINRFIPR